MKKFVWQLLEKPAFGFIRNLVSVRKAYKDAGGTRKMAKRLGFSLLDKKTFAVLREKSSTLVILGGGESVEEVSPAQWRGIERCASVGVNHWPLHDFVADMYSFEGGYELEPDARDAISFLLKRDDIRTKNPKILLLRPASSSALDSIPEIPHHLAREVRLYGRTNVTTRKSWNLFTDLCLLLRSINRRGLPEFVTIDGGMSVSRLISLGAKAKFRSIVLVGVDLKSTEYFFDVNRTYLQRRGIEHYNSWQPGGDVHETEDTSARNFAASEFIPALASAVLSETGTKVFVSSASSALSAHLPLFDLDFLEKN